MVPVNAPPDREVKLVVDSGSELFGGGTQEETFSMCDQYTLQGDAFSLAILEGREVPVPVEDAIANMAVIEALFRSAKSGQWERPGA